MIRPSRTLLAAAAAIVPAALMLTAAPAGASATVNHSATSHLTGRPDSGVQGNDWALDTLTRSASIHLAGAAALSHCGGHTGTGHCYEWTGKITDTGTAATIAGQLAPGAGDQNGGAPITLGEAISAKVTGAAAYVFYSSWKTADRWPPASEAGAPAGRETTGLWPELFFRSSGPAFWDASGNPDPSSVLTAGGWTYTAALGADAACPHVSSQWTDASPDWGANAADGNVLAPDAAHC